MQAVMGLLRRTRAKLQGEVWLNGTELLQTSNEQLRRRRGAAMAMIFQDPLSALHPYYTIGNQIEEAYLVHNDGSRKDAHKRAIEMLDRVGIPNASRRIDQYPHEFSGGMRQRAMIAMALINDPKLLIADEPTTALDVTVQAQILALLQRLQGELGMAIVIITHDLGVVAQTADDIAVMYAGRIVERTSAKLLFGGPEHPYTWGLLKSIPSLSGTRKEQLVPISGSPPSLINRPPGCHFHPRCPYSQPDHARIDPQLQPVAGDPAHHVACLLEASVRRRLWAELSDGKTPEQARASVGLPAPQEAAASAADTAGDMPEVGL
jgi:peptide/nickel transport system ATP-binding protein